MNSSLLLRLCLGSAMIILVSAHSCLRCAKWDPITGACAAGPRNEGNLFEEEAYLWAAGTPICQSTWVNPISSYYSNGPSCPDFAECPDPMGTFTPGETFTIMWCARNHAEADEDPDTVFLYLSPVETLNQGSDATEAVFEQNLICSAPYMSCGGLNGNTVNCSTQCTMPSNVAPGVYTMLWTWPWQGVIYTTCTDITVTASNSGSTPSPPPPTPPATTGKKPSVTTSKAASSTTGKVASSTTGKAASSTTGKASSSSSTSSRLSTSSSSSSSSSTSTSTSSGSCTVGNMKCVGTNQYSTCSPTRTGTAWSATQSCPSGLSCVAVQGSYIQCQ